MNKNQIKALDALRAADESKRLQGAAFKNGRMCACVIILNGIEPGSIDVKGNSNKTTSDGGKVYTLISKLFSDYNAIINLNDARDEVRNSPKYTFAEIADQLEPKWRQEAQT